MSVGWALAAAVAALLLRGLAGTRARRERARLADRRLLARLVPLPGRPTALLRSGLLAAGVAALAGSALFGAAKPPRPAAEAGAPETVLVLDASNSMLATDVTPNRLERQRRLARRLVGALPGPVGVVFFAGRGWVLSPLTPDRDAALMFVDAVDPAGAGRGGTSLGAGLEAALNVLAGGEPGARRAVVLLSDGELTADEGALDATVERAARAEVAVHALGIGTAGGSRIPLLPAAAATSGRSPAQGAAGFLRDPEGQPVVTRLEEAALRRIAAATGGLYLPGTPAGVDRLLREIVGEGRGRVPAGLPLEPLLLLAFLLLWADGFLFRRG